MKFTIAIPAFKARYLCNAIESCLNQTFSDFEIVVVDDASPENLASVVEKFDDNRIRFFRNDKNFGAIDVVDNWNKCLEYAKGEYIICMGDDDRLKPCCLEEIAKLMEKYPRLGLYHSWTEIIDEDDKVFDIQEHRPEWESVYSLVWHKWMYRRRQYIGDFCFNVQLLRDNGGFYKLPLAWASDEISAAIAAIPYGVANTQVPCFQYRVNRHTISKSANDKIKVDAILLECKWYETFMNAKPSNDLDQTFHSLLEKEWNKHWEKKIASYVGQDIRSKPYKALWWFLHKKHYSLNMHGYIRAIVNALIYKN